MQTGLIIFERLILDLVDFIGGIQNYKKLTFNVNL
jgi:hypothetical protein